MSTNCGNLKGRIQTCHTSSQIISNPIKHIVDDIDNDLNVPKLI